MASTCRSARQSGPWSPGRCRASPGLRALAADHEALAAKRRALVAALPRLLWREALATEERRALDAMPDAFDSVMEVLAGRRNATR